MYPIQIREGHANGRELSHTEAIFAAMGIDERASRVVVTAVYAEDTDGGKDYRRQQITHKAGEAVFGMDAEVMPRHVAFAAGQDAAVSIGGIGSHSPEDAMVRVECYRIAAEIAAAANAAAAVLRNAK